MGTLNCKKINKDEMELHTKEKQSNIKEEEPIDTDQIRNDQIESEKSGKNPNQKINNLENQPQNEEVEQKIEKEEKVKFEEPKVVKIEEKVQKKEEKVENQDQNVENLEVDEKEEEDEKEKEDEKDEEKVEEKNDNAQKNIRKEEPLDSVNKIRKKQKVPQDSVPHKSSDIEIRSPTRKEIEDMKKKKGKKKKHKKNVNIKEKVEKINEKGKKEEKIDKEKKDKEEEKFVEIEEENDALKNLLFTETMIETIYNNNNQVVNDPNANLNNNNNKQSLRNVTTASKQGAIDLSNMQILNSTELNKNNSNNQQKLFTNSPPNNMNFINNVPSSAFSDNNPYNEDLSNLQAISYKIQNEENKSNIEQNRNFNLNNNVKQNNNNNSSRYNLGLASMGEKDNRNNVNEKEQIKNNNSNDPISIEDSKSIVTFCNQQNISNNNNIKFSKESLSKISNQNFSPTRSYSYNYSLTVPVKSSQP